jgi:bifunctional non-homologous end joining protein LigD
MPLEEYNKKRDFSRTPEPAGRVVRRKGQELFFCVQKHLASHLHYDFRLEHNGVLLSWAVPKGPSLDPGTKRLAMQTEDHPLEYGEFEGVIPEGYGAGIVMLWDRGTWTPESDDVEGALKRGDLKFRLDGYKLKGSWVLVRTGGRYGSGNRSWLLIKHRDEWAGDLDIMTFAPRSVKSDGDFEDILAEDTPAVWQSNRPAKSGDAGAMLARIIERAAALKAEPRRDAKAATKARKHEGESTPAATKARRRGGKKTGSVAKGRTSAKSGPRRKTR